VNFEGIVNTNFLGVLAKLNAFSIKIGTAVPWMLGAFGWWWWGQVPNSRLLIIHYNHDNKNLKNYQLTVDIAQYDDVSSVSIAMGHNPSSNNWIGHFIQKDTIYCYTSH
jgi:hypothetical protein